MRRVPIADFDDIDLQDKLHSQILMFNMDWLDPCIFVPDEYLIT